MVARGSLDSGSSGYAEAEEIGGGEEGLIPWLRIPCRVAAYLNNGLQPSSLCSAAEPDRSVGVDTMDLFSRTTDDDSIGREWEESGNATDHPR
jgi:hypothetical protein